MTESNIDPLFFPFKIYHFPFHENTISVSNVFIDEKLLIPYGKHHSKSLTNEVNKKKKTQKREW